MAPGWNHDLTGGLDPRPHAFGSIDGFAQCEVRTVVLADEAQRAAEVTAGRCPRLPSRSGTTSWTLRHRSGQAAGHRARNSGGAGAAHTDTDRS